LDLLTKESSELCPGGFLKMGSGTKDSTPAMPKSTSGVRAAVHPLVLLTISDYVTRHTLRNQTGPIIGALLGQKEDKSVTVEHAFDCKTSSDGTYSLYPDWFTTRLEQSTSKPTCRFKTSPAANIEQ
jgi:COP9 signalosome complex subunit 6